MAFSIREVKSSIHFEYGCKSQKKPVKMLEAAVRSNGIIGRARDVTAIKRKMFLVLKLANSEEHEVEVA